MSCNIECGNFSPRTTSSIIGCTFTCVDAKYSTLETRVLKFQGVLFLTSSKYTYSNCSWQEHQCDQCIHFISTKKLINFDLKTIEWHTGYTPWMLCTPFSVKLLSSLLWTEAFRSTRNCGKPWSTQRGHSFGKDSLGYKGVHFFSQNWAQTVSATQGFTSTWLQGLNTHSKNQWITNWTRKITYTHTHTHIQTHKVLIYCSLSSEQIS
jgi:hypothetical protein